MTRRFELLAYLGRRVLGSVDICDSTSGVRTRYIVSVQWEKLKCQQNLEKLLSADCADARRQNKVPKKHHLPDPAKQATV